MSTPVWTGPRPRRRNGWTATLPVDVAAHVQVLHSNLDGHRMRTPDHYAAMDRLDAYLLALHRAGWPLAVIGEPIGLDRRSVWNRLARSGVDDLVCADGMPVPLVQTHREPESIPA